MVNWEGLIEKLRLKPAPVEGSKGHAEKEPNDTSGGSGNRWANQHSGYTGGVIWPGWYTGQGSKIGASRTWLSPDYGFLFTI